MTIRDLTFGCFFVVLPWLILTVTLRKYLLLRWKKDLCTNLCFPCAFAVNDCFRHSVRLIPPRSALVNICWKALSPIMIFTQDRTVFCFYIFQAGNHLWKCKCLQFKRKKNWCEGQEDSNPWPKLPLHHTYHPLTTRPLRICWMARKWLKFT